LLPVLAPLLAPDARVYVERPNMQPAPPLPAGWTLARESRTGSVTMCLYAVAFAGDGGMKQEGNGGADEGTPED
jgi:hypothetical protein